MTGQIVRHDDEDVLQFAPGCGRGGCVAGSGCGWQRPPRRVPLRWLMADNEGLRPGQAAVLHVHAGGLAGSAWACFGLPLLALAAGGWLGARWLAHVVGDPEIAAGIGGLLAAMLTLAAVSRWGSRLERRLDATIAPAETTS
jgi:positive regulator of sigma E activity